MKKLLSFVLIVVMLLTFMPTTVWAATVYVTDEASLRNAISSATDGDTIVLSNDIPTITFDYTNSINIEKDITIDFNGKTITTDAHAAYALFLGNATVTIKNGNFICLNKAFLIENDGGGKNLSIENCTITVANDFAALTNYSNLTFAGNVTISGNIINQSSSSAIVNNGTLTVHGDIVNKGTIINNGTIQNYATIDNNYGGTFDNGNGTINVYLPHASILGNMPNPYGIINFIGGSSGGGTTTSSPNFTFTYNPYNWSLSANGIAMKCNGEYADFTDLTIDGESLRKGTDYTVKSGSTIFTIKASYLKKLSNGDHTVTAYYTNGYGQTTLTINGNPKTGDDSNVVLWCLLAVLAVGTLILVLPKKKRVQ